MNNFFGIHIWRFIALVLVQVGICNHINFLGYINPYIYIIFILLFPINSNRQVFLIISFLLGLTIDLFSDSGGVHATAALVLAYSRPLILKSSFGLMYDYQSVKFSHSDFGSLFTYVVVATLLHHLVLFTLEIFNLSLILLILKKVVFSGLFTCFLSLIILILFSKGKR